MIYFAQHPTGAIKIGVTNCLATRLDEHCAKEGKPLSILGVVDGGRDVEQELHQRFDHLRLNRDKKSGAVELFEPEEELMTYIAGNCREPEVIEPRTVRVDLSPAVHKGLRKAAAEDEMSMAALARKVVEEYVAKRVKGGGK